MSDVKTPEGQVKAKVLVKDLRTKKSAVLDMKVVSLEPNRLRMDLTTTLGMHVFSLASVEDQVEYIVVKQKKHFKGSNSERALMPVLKVPINPAHLRNVIFQRPIPDKDWSCTADGDSLKDCINMRTKIKVVWKKGRDNRPRIEITYSKRAKIQISVRKVSEFEGDAGKAFSLKVPKSFKRISL